MNQKYKELLAHINLASIKKEDINMDLHDAVNFTLAGLNNGYIKVCEKINNQWVINLEAKTAICLSFMIKNNFLMNNEDNFHNIGFDKFPSKFINWHEDDFIKHKIRVLPGGLIRYSAFIGENSILMPSFVNVGAYIDSGTMIDTWSTVGSCAHIGKSVHISGGVGIGGVLEPIVARPTIIEDGCFIGARSEICEGVIIGQGSVIAMGCFIGASTKIINRTTGEITLGYVPPYSVVVPGNYQYPNNTKLSGYCVMIIKEVDEQTRRKTSVNELLRGE